MGQSKKKGEMLPLENESVVAENTDHAVLSVTVPISHFSEGQVARPLNCP